MEILRVQNLSFTYPNSDTKALSDVSFSIERGSFVTLCGLSGSGKSTLLRHLKPELAPKGQKSGAVLFEGVPLETLEARKTCSKLGYIAQNSADQIVTDRVWHELAFGLESLGVPNDQIRARVAEIAGFFGISKLFHKHTTELSGGEEQLVCLASVMVMQPEILLLDEPTAKLDPIAASSFLQTLSRLNRELGTTILLSEQRTADAFALSDRVMVMDKGQIIADAPPHTVADTLFRTHNPMTEALPCPMRVYYAASPSQENAPLTEREGRAWLEKQILDRAAIPDESPSPETPTVLEAKGIFFRYEKNAPFVLQELSLRLHKGEIYALFGANGAGKSTALSVLAGAKKPQSGSFCVQADHHTCLLPQEPCDLFCEKSVRRDLSGVPGANEESINRVTGLCQLEELLDRHPYDLSGGERQRAALAKVLLTGADILLLDEPTKGMDAAFKKELAVLLLQLKEQGYTLLLVSHDIEFCAQIADTCGLFFDGSIVSQAPTRRFLSANRYYTTAAHRMSVPLLENAVTENDLCRALGVPPHSTPQVPSTKPRPTAAPHKSTQKASVSQPQPKPPVTALAAWTVLSGVFTLLCGMYLFDDRKYYFISLMLIVELLFPFFLSFEKRKPPARELALLAALSALGVAGRAAFFMLPEFKPVAALVITVGICFGSEYGCIVGALSAFLSNFFFGQGPWTPWQMFAFALLGFLAGTVYHARKKRPSRVAVTFFGFFAVLVLYGALLDTSTVLMTTAHPTLSAFAVTFAAGFPVNLLHAFATALFLFFLFEPFADKFDRIRIKYGIGSHA